MRPKATSASIFKINDFLRFQFTYIFEWNKTDQSELKLKCLVFSLCVWVLNKLFALMLMLTWKIEEIKTILVKNKTEIR